MVQLRVLGGLTVTLLDGRRPSPTAMQPRRLAVLALLARAGGRGISRDRLHTLLWPDRDDEAARRGLTQALYALRSGLDCPELVIGIQELRLNHDVVRCDLFEFDAAMTARDLDRAVAQYDGPFINGFRVPGVADFDRWVEEERAEIAGRFDVLLERLAKREAERGDLVGAAQWWRRRATGDPLNARVAVSVMRALAASGDRAGALAHARVYQALLHQELGVEPDASVATVADELRASSPVLAVPPLAPASTAPEQVAVPSPAASTPASETTSAAATVPVARSTTPWTMRIAALVAPILLLGAIAVVVTVVRRPAPIRTAALARIADPLRVTSDEGLELDPAISPDGTQIAYAAGVEGAMRIFLRQRNGSRALAVVTDQSGEQRRPRWSPDGTRLLYQSQRGLWLIPALGGTARRIVDPPADPLRSARFGAWSPDGRTIAWIQGDSLYSRILESGATRALAEVTEGHSASWSPDGRWIALVSGNPYFQFGSIGYALVTSAGVGNLAPSGILLVPTGCASGSAACSPRAMTTKSVLNTSPDWLSSDQLVFVSNRGGARDLFVQQLAPNGSPVGEPQRLTSGVDAASVSVARDGATLAYSVFRQSSNVWSLPLEPSASPAMPTQITRGAQTIEGLDVSADGAWLAYDTDAAGQQDIYVMPLDRGQSARADGERVVDSPVDDFHPTWSPDGKWLAYYTFVDGVRRASVVPAHGGVPSLIHPSGPNREEHSPVWALDGQSLLYFRSIESGPQLYESPRAPSGTWGPERQLTRRGGLGASFALDGTIAYFSAPGDMRLLPPTKDENASRQVYRSPTDPSRGVTAKSGRMSRDGRLLIIKGIDRVGTGFWTTPVSGGPLRLVARLDDVQKPSLRPEFTSDDRYVYYTRVERQADIWSMRLTR